MKQNYIPLKFWYFCLILKFWYFWDHHMLDHSIKHFLTLEMFNIILLSFCSDWYNKWAPDIRIIEQLFRNIFNLVAFLLKILTFSMFVFLGTYDFSGVLYVSQIIPVVFECSNCLNFSQWESTFYWLLCCFNMIPLIF